MRIITPLRYPGGKGRIAKWMEKTIKGNSLDGGTYMEPFAGGASIALHLLKTETVENVIINDYDIAIYSFWYAVLNEPKKLIKKIQDTPITIDEWEKQRTIYKSPQKQYSLELAFAAFFMNRCNFSGVLKGGAIGGRNQLGKYKINARFNKANLIKRIEYIATLSDKITLTHLDALDFIENYVKKSTNSKTIVYYDPPYFNKGAWLYKNYFTKEDHLKLADSIKSVSESAWIVSYDDCDEIREIYEDCQNDVFQLGYSAHQNTKSGTEFLAWHNIKLSAPSLKLN